ncbi:MAG: hypothetical protein AAFS10_26740, partial [Myxococcota bacterium]
MSRQHWTGTIVKTEIRRDDREALADLDLNTTEDPAPKLYGGAIAIWLMLALGMGVGMSVLGVGSGAACIMSLFLSAIFFLLLLKLFEEVPLTEWVAMEAVWAVQQRFLSLLGMAQTVEDPGWVKQTMRVPVAVMLDASSVEPQFSWSYDRDAAEVLTRTRTAHHPLGSTAAGYHKEAQDTVQVALKDGGLVLELTRIPDDAEGRAHLTLRVGRERITFELDAEHLALSDDAWQALPMLAQEAVVLPEKEQRSLLVALEEVGQAIGVPVPAALRVRR